MPQHSPAPTSEPDGATAAGDGGAAPVMSRSQVLKAISGLMMAMFVAILAATVVATALPRMVADLDGSQSLYTWVVTAELLAMTATVPLWGKLADLYDKKLLVQLSLAFFLVGSLAAGFTPSMEVLIASRAVQGIGAGGLTALVQVVMATIIPPRQLGRYAGVFGAVFAVGTVSGPLVGGAMVDTPWLGWRWCFFLGVPFTVAAIVLLQRTLHLPRVPRNGEKPRIDYLGAFLIMSGVSTLLVWTSLAGHEFAWASGWSAALVGAGTVLVAAAIVVEARVAEPIIPLSIFRNRTISLVTVASTLVGVAMFGGTVFLSQYFQTSLGKSPTVAGLMSLPMIAGLIVSSTVGGSLVTRTGRLKPFLVVGAVLVPTGLGLLSTIGAHTSVGRISLFMVVLGVGMGLLMQNLVLAAQNAVAASDLGAATSVVSFFRSMGGAVGTSVLGAVLANRVGSLSAERLPHAGGDGSPGVPDLTTLSGPVLAAVQEIYATAVSDVFLVVTPIAALTLVAVLLLRETPLQTTSGQERLVAEREAEAAASADAVTGVEDLAAGREVGVADLETLGLRPSDELDPDPVRRVEA